MARFFAQPSTPTCSNRCGCNQAIRTGEIEYLVKWTEEHNLQRRCISPACQEMWPIRVYVTTYPEVADGGTENDVPSDVSREI